MTNAKPRDPIKRLEYDRAWRIRSKDKIDAANRRYRQHKRWEIRARQREWDNAHRDNKREYNRQHRDEINAKTTAYYYMHKEEIAARRREHREEIKRYMDAYRVTHHQALVEWRVLYRGQHRVELAAQQRAREARKRGNGGECTVEEWLSVCKQWGNKCLCCGTTEKLSCDHVVPLVCGGRNDIKNLQLLCVSCNCKKHDKTIDYRPETRIVNTSVPLPYRR